MAAVSIVTAGSRIGRTLSVLLVTTMLAGCAQTQIGGMGQKESNGTEIGVVVGAVAGSFLGRGSGRVVGAALGAAIGGLIGNRIGAMLDQQDQEALAERSQLALVSDADNAPTHWQSDHTAAQATIVPENTRQVHRTVKLVRSARVEMPSNLDMIGADDRVIHRALVRLAPRGGSQVTATLPSGSTIRVVAKVHDEPWVLVARHGVSIGYVAASSVKPVMVAAVGHSDVQAAAFDLDTAAPVRTPEDLDALPAKDPAVKVATVEASVTCRDLKTTATLEGQTETSTETACRAPDGSWDIE